MTPVPFRTLSALVFLLLADPAAAQVAGEPGQEAGRLPEGWHARFDQADAGLDEVIFRAHDSLYRVVHGPAAIYYRLTSVGSGSFEVSASFVQEAELPHPEGYGLFIGGSDLAGEDQRYTYFLIRQDGRFMVRRRSGDRLATVIDWTVHPSIRAGTAPNSLAVVAERDTIRFLANGTEMTALPRSTLYAEGLVGFRVNHRLTLTIRAFEVRPH